jgi:hypothetical protein
MGNERSGRLGSVKSLVGAARKCDVRTPCSPFRGNIRGMKNSVRFLLLALLAVIAPSVGAGESPRPIHGVVSRVSGA